jgi:methylenetetrahydrofolate reductase (NADPH)
MTRIDEILAGGNGPIVSFEFGPPRSVEAELAFWNAIEELAKLEPAFVSVTCGAGGTTRDLTLAVVRRLARERGLEAVPHVTATGFTRAELVHLLAEAAAGGADNVLALRGDPPRGEQTWRAPEGGVKSSLELVSLAALAGFCVLGAAYPEPHRDSRGWEADIDHVRAKVDAGVRVLVTQLFFDNDDYRRYLERLGAAGVEVPVLPGIIPITSIGQIERLSALCGACIPDGLRRELEARQDDPRAVAELGVAYATAQAAELLADGAPGIHLYTLNRSPATRAIVSALRAQGALCSTASTTSTGRR